MFKHFATKMITVLFVVPIIALILVIIFNESGLYSDLENLVMAVSTGLLTAGLIFLLIENKLKSVKDELQGIKDEITILLRTEKGEGEIELPAKIRRRDFTRAEVLGRIGMVPLKDPKENGFRIAYTNAPEFIENIHAIYESEGNAQLIITCTREELEQFDVFNPSRETQNISS